MSKEKDNLIKPAIKWVGGKTQIIDKLLSEFPKEINNYYEVFLGGGSVLLGLLYYIHKEKIVISGGIYVYDVNETLINLYKNIQSNSKEFITHTKKIIKVFNSIIDTEINRNASCLEEAKTSQESFYYWIRRKYNSLTQEEKNGIKGSSYFLFLNKTCFRGLYRVGPNGFNVPYGHYKNPEILNEKHINDISNIIQDVKFNVLSFENTLNFIVKNKEENDFIYLDPPYVPENNNSFTKYDKDDFTIEKHETLFKLCNKIDVNFLMSNSDTDLVKENFSKDKFKIETINCKRTINSKKPGSKTNELLIKNF